MKRETLFLKVVVFLIGIPVLALCIFGLPWIADEAAEHYPESAYLKYPVFVGVYVPYMRQACQSYSIWRKILEFKGDEDTQGSNLSKGELHQIGLTFRLNIAGW